jgi:TolB-like protein
MIRSLKVFAALALLAAPLAAQNTPVVTVLAFENSSFGFSGAKDYDGIGKGIMDLMITDLASGTKVRVVDRERVNKLLEEQNLTKSGAIDGNTAIRVGKLFGACYSIYGSFLRDAKGKQVLTIHTTNNETGQIQNPVRIESNDDDAMKLIADASAKFISSMNVTACGGNAGARRGGDASPAQQGNTSTTPAANTSASATVTYAKTLKPEEVKKLHSVKLDARTMLVYSRALDAKDRKETTRAKQLAEQVSAKYPDFQPATDLIASLNSGN